MTVHIGPQDGPQTQFRDTEADIAIMGGGAYGGKTWALMFEDSKHYEDERFASVTFRRTTNQITNPGGLWDEAKMMYVPVGARPIGSSPLELRFPSNAIARFAHLEHADSVTAWDGAQIPLIKFDQLEHFLESQFFYMLSRNRDPSGHIKPYCRATCNPSPDSWLKRFLAWWLDPKTGYAIPERSGKLRWFVREGDTMTWADTREELVAQFGRADLAPDHPLQPRPMSVTFILARIWDNKIGLERDPGYVSKLKGMVKHERERLLGDPDLGGNWNVRATAGTLFQRDWCSTLDVEPEDVRWVRGWDLAASAVTPLSPDPDWTVGVRLGQYHGRKRWVIAADVKRARLAPAGVDKLLRNAAEADGVHVEQHLPQDPGQAGKSQVAAMTGSLHGFTVRSSRETGDKVTRFGPFSAQAEAGNVDLVRGLPEEYLSGLEAFPDALHDDDADATSKAFNAFQVTHLGFLDYARRQVEQQEERENTVAPIGPGGRPVVDAPAELPPGVPARNGFVVNGKPMRTNGKAPPPSVAELDAATPGKVVRGGEWPE